jgi:YjbE family integral membrane protein
VLITPDLIPRILQIILIDLVLSGDNAVVIGMAAHPLPPRQRRIAIIVGGAAALVLRASLTSIAALLLGLPALKAVGGLLLLWIAYRLLKQEEESGESRVATTMRGTILTILLADFIMSLDNVLGVAAASGGDVPLLIFGLTFSMAILMVGGSVFAQLIDRLWWLAYVGAFVIAWTGFDMFQDDQYVAEVIKLPDYARLIVSAVVSSVVVALAHRVHRRRPATLQTG